MTHTEIINKIIGPINPIGETNTDNERFENLKQMCDLVDNLVSQIDSVHYKNKDSHEFSVKRASDYASNFLSQRLGIV